MRRKARSALVVSAVVVLAGWPASVGAAAANAPARPRRVLIITTPRLTWDRLLAAHAPNLRRLFDTGTVASLAVRTDGARTTPISGYATLGAGNRARAVSGAALFSQRVAGGLIVAGDIGALKRENDRRLYGTQPGLLGETLRRHGYRTGVVANADFGDTEQRAAALALMSRDGTVQSGDVRADAGDPVLAAAAFDHVWSQRSVVLVELSDLEGADATASDAAVEQALADDDAIVGHLLASVGPDDLVMVVAPVAPRAGERLTPFAIKGPGFAPGLADSGTTRRAGYVTLPDIAPTILTSLGIDVPSHMNGAGIRRASAVDPATRLHHLRDRAALAVFHDHALGALNVWWFALLFGALALALAVLATARRRGGADSRGWRAASGAVRLFLLGAMAYPIVSFLLGLVRYDRLGSRAAVALVLVGSSAVVAVAVELAAAAVSGNRPAPRRVLAPGILCAMLLTLLVADVLAGAPMQIDTVFGYSPIGAGRFAGLGNQAYSFLIAAAIVAVCSAWAVARTSGRWNDALARWALPAAAAVFVGVVVVDGLPMLGSDVGGALTTLPAAAVVLVLLAGKRLSFRRVAAVVGATVALLALFTAIDLARPASQRTHLGRLAHEVLHGGDSMGALSIRRKLDAMLGTLHSTWLLPFLGAVVVLVLVGRLRVLRDLDTQVPGVRAALVGTVVVGVLAALLNDSGISMPATMAGVLLPFLLYAGLRLEGDPRDEVTGR